MEKERDLHGHKADSKMWE